MRQEDKAEDEGGGRRKQGVNKYADKSLGNSAKKSTAGFQAWAEMFGSKPLIETRFHPG